MTDTSLFGRMAAKAETTDRMVGREQQLRKLAAHVGPKGPIVNVGPEGPTRQKTIVGPKGPTRPAAIVGYKVRQGNVPGGRSPCLPRGAGSQCRSQGTDKAENHCRPRGADKADSPCQPPGADKATAKTAVHRRRAPMPVPRGR